MTTNQPQGNQNVMFTLTGSTSYDPDEVYSSSTDSKGHGERERIRFPPPIQAQMHAVVQSGAMPKIRTVEDYVRNAVVHRLHYDLANGQPGISGTVLTHERATAILFEHQANLAQWKLILKSLADTGEEYLTTGALDDLARLLTQFDSQYSESTMPDKLQTQYDEILETLHSRLTVEEDKLIRRKSREAD